MTRLLAAAGLMALLLGSSAAFAQAPPPVPALPDTQRLTAYSISGTTCACAVNFALYGDGTDYQNWVQVFFNGSLVSFNDPTFGWTITSPSGPLASISRPITNAILTFNSVQTGNVQIVGARRPRRTSQFQENQGVAARDLNQVITDLTAQNRETWDKVRSAQIGGTGITVTVRTATSLTDTITINDYFVCADNSTAAATENLPNSPAAGLTFLIKDCAGTASAHSITVTPASGLIDGLSTFVMGTNYQSAAFTYDGVQWRVN